MKINIEIDVSPDEARRFLGLPEVGEANAALTEALAKGLKGASTAEQVQDYAKMIAPMGQIGFKLFQQFVENSGGAKPKP